MKKLLCTILSFVIIIGLISSAGCAIAYSTDYTSKLGINVQNLQSEMKPKLPENKEQAAKEKRYTLEQAISDNAQLSTIAFNGLAFITGSSGADTFMPPGKVADFFGFQYMRDVDTAGYGHNTTFLGKAANNVLYILNDEQKSKLIELAKEQSPLYIDFAYNRFPIMNAFRRNMEGKIPAGSKGLDIQAVSRYTAALYKTDADLSYNRAIVVGEIINSFSPEQKAYLDKMQFNNSATWPAAAENEEIKRSLTHTEFVAVMTYASELFSWYKGGIDADVYFCPERHGTYFGGFYMKDYPAMNNPDYFISTEITGDKGKEFLNILNPEQRALITGIIDEQRAALSEIAQIRAGVAAELRKAMAGEAINKEKVYSLIERYGELDGQISAIYAIRFSQINKTLTQAQRAELVKLRNLDVVPKGAYMFSDPIDMPQIPNTDFMFGVGNVPENAGQMAAPQAQGSYTASDFNGSIILGRPNNSSITANITSNELSQVYLMWGEASNQYSHKSSIKEVSDLSPAVIVMDGLEAGKAYYYRLFFKASNSAGFKSTPEYTYRTPRKTGEDYTFVVQSDSHLKNKADKDIYAMSMRTIAGYKPDFIFDLGDTFLNDQAANPQYQDFETIRKTSFEQRSFFDIVTRSAALFLTIGNHEGEYGYFLDGTDKNLTVMSALARKTYYPNPVPDEFYSGNIEKEPFVGLPQNYYAFEWGDALYVSIDPYRYSGNDPYNDKDGWKWTLGKVQYDWFRKTLEESKAKYKFVFAHHAIGNIRGGAEIAKLYEWGGYDKNGKYLFDEKRPGWGKPIQQIMKDTGVTIFFQGHDHLFARENVDGVIYQTLPKPAEKTADKQSNGNAYPDCDKLLNSGFLKVDVNSENVQVDYYRNYYVSSEPQEGNTGIVYSYIVDEDHNVKVLKSTADDFSTYGSGEVIKKTKKNDKPQKKSKGKDIIAEADEKNAGGIILGCPTDTSMTVKAIAVGDMDVYFEYGDDQKSSLAKTESVSYKNGEVIETVIDNLTPDTQYYYKILARKTGSSVYMPLQTGTFHTARSRGEAFTFTIQSDSHRDENSDIALYRKALQNVIKDKPDFHIDLGDTFMGEKLGITKEGTNKRYLEDRSFFTKITDSIPLFLVNGNHEGENGWSMQKSTDNIAMWASGYRHLYFPNPGSNSFYTGSTAANGNYYAFEWGDALFVTLDPFWFTESKAKDNEDGWNYTLGKTQYDWFRKTLEESTAKYKFVFVHNLTGGYGKDARGGAEASKYYEWGGYNADGSYEFDKMRPGWGKPIHQLMVDSKVTAVFHGHDHFYAKQELDGIIYQLVPQPSHPGSDVRNAAEYSYEDGVFLPPAGHLRVLVSDGSVRVDYVKASMQEGKNGSIADSYEVYPK